MFNLNSVDNNSDYIFLDFNYVNPLNHEGDQLHFRKPVFNEFVNFHGFETIRVAYIPDNFEFRDATYTDMGNYIHFNPKPVFDINAIPSTPSFIILGSVFFTALFRKRY